MRNRSLSRWRVVAQSISAVCDGEGIGSRLVNVNHSTGGHRDLPTVTRKRYSSTGSWPMPPYVHQTLCTPASADKDWRETTVPVPYLLIVYPGRRIASLFGTTNAISTPCPPPREDPGPGQTEKNRDLASIYPLILVDKNLGKGPASGRSSTARR